MVGKKTALFYFCLVEELLTFKGLTNWKVQPRYTKQMLSTAQTTEPISTFQLIFFKRQSRIKRSQSLLLFFLLTQVSTSMRKAGICMGSMTRRTQAVNITEQWLLGESCQIFSLNDVIPDNTVHLHVFPVQSTFVGC